MQIAEKQPADDTAPLRVDQLVDAVGDLLAMAQTAADNGEATLASHLRNAADAARMHLGAADPDTALGWAEIYQCNLEDRRLVTDELQQWSTSRHFTPSAKATLRMAVVLLA